MKQDKRRKENGYMQSTLFPLDSFDGLESNNQHYNKGLFPEQSHALSFPSVGSVALKPNKLKVAAYCRVSTLMDMQENSLENQINHYTNLIRSNPEWRFAGIYSDRGKTGTKIVGRSGFQRMIRHALDGKIDLIQCKSISRFARNVTDTLDVIRMLKEHNIQVIFEKENIDTFSMHSEFIITLLAAVAQEESRSISENMTWSTAKSFEMGKPKFIRILGYKLDKKKNWIVVEEEADIVREAFELYLKGVIVAQIAKTFISKGYKKANGRIDWGSTAISSMLKNEKYTGDVLCQKTYVEDHLTHKIKINKGERNQYLIKNHHEAIIDNDTFDKAQKMLLNGKKQMKRGKSNSYPLTGRLICGNCGGKIYKCLSRGNTIYRCTNRTKSKELCSMKSVSEENIKKAIIEAFNKRYHLNGRAQAKKQIQTMIKGLENAMSHLDFELNQLKLELERILFKENIAIIKINKDRKSEMNVPFQELEAERKIVEERIKIKEDWGNLLDADSKYRKVALEKLKVFSSINRPSKELKEQLNQIEFIRAWVVNIKVFSPQEVYIAWFDGDETLVELS